MIPRHHFLLQHETFSVSVNIYWTPVEVSNLATSIHLFNVKSLEDSRWDTGDICMVARDGFEPSSHKAGDFKSPVFTNFTNGPW